MGRHVYREEQARQSRLHAIQRRASPRRPQGKRLHPIRARASAPTCTSSAAAPNSALCIRSGAHKVASRTPTALKWASCIPGPPKRNCTTPFYVHQHGSSTAIALEHECTRPLFVHQRGQRSRIRMHYAPLRAAPPHQVAAAPHGQTRDHPMQPSLHRERDDPNPVRSSQAQTDSPQLGAIDPRPAQMTPIFRIGPERRPPKLVS